MKVKKVIALLLAVSMVLSMTFSSFAESNNTKVNVSIAKIESADEVNVATEMKDIKEEIKNTEEKMNQETISAGEKIEKISKSVENMNAYEENMMKEHNINVETNTESEEEYSLEMAIASESMISSKLFGDAADRHYVFHFDLNVPSGETVDESSYSDKTIFSTNISTFPDNPECQNYLFDGWTSDVGLLFERQSTIEHHMNHNGYDWIKNHFLRTKFFRIIVRNINFTLDDYWNEFATNDEIEVNLTANWIQKNLDRFTINIEPNLPQGTNYDPFQFDGLNIDSSDKSMTATYNVRTDNNCVEWNRGGFSLDDEENEKASDFAFAWSSIDLRDQEPDINYTFRGYWYENLGVVSNFTEDEYFDSIADEIYANTEQIPVSEFDNNSITLYAVWDKQTTYDYVVRFYDSDTNALIRPSQFLEENQKITKPTSSSRIGYDLGWYYTNSSGDEELWDFNTTVTEDINLYAKWTPKTYEINYNVGTGASVSPTLFVKTYDTAIIADLATPSKIGHTFGGWFTTDDLTTAYDKTTDDIYVEGKTTPYNIYAKWTANTYNVSFNLASVGATAPTLVSKTYGQARTDDLPEPSNIPAGYEFLGWYKESTYEHQWTGKVATDDLTTENGVTIPIYAKWKRAVIFNVTYNGNSINAMQPDSIDITSPTTITLPNTSAVGYTFGGWYRSATDFTDANFVGMNGASGIAVDSPTTFYAKWTPHEYTINYNTVLTDATIAEDSIPKTYGIPVTLATPSREGYDFAGWFKNYNASNKSYTDPYNGTLDIISEDGGSTTIYAKWTAHTYTIKYNVDGIGTAPANKSKSFGSPISLNNPINVPDGYIFDGWYSDEGLADEHRYEGSTDLTTDDAVEVNVYARYKARITYNVNSHGSVSPTYVDVILNQETTLPTLTNVTGFTFDNNWYGEAGCTNLIGAAESNYTVTAPKTLYAKWIENTHKVILHIDGGTFNAGYTDFIINTTTSNYEKNRLYSVSTTLPTSANIIKVGYTFNGWYDNAGMTGAKVTQVPAKTDAEKEYWLKWNENTYSITYNENGGVYVNGYSKPTGRTYTANTELPTSDKISKTGYDFGGWYDNSEFSGSAITNIGPNVAAPKVLYAKWDEKTYSITYKDYDGTNITPYVDDTNAHWKSGYTSAPTSRRYTGSAVLPGDGNVVKRNNFFLGWFKEGDTSETIITSINANTTEDIVLRAKWDTAYEVTFNYLGFGTNETDLVRNGQRVGKPNDPTYENKRFAGWYKTYDSSAPIDEQFTDQYNFNDVVTESFTLYAKWEDATTYEVSFNLTSGTIHPNASDVEVVPNQYIVSGNRAQAPSTPVSNGYVFKGWFANPELTTPYNFNTGIIEQTIIYAKWDLITYTIKYSLNGGAWAEGYTAVTSWQWTTSNLDNLLPTSTNITRNHYTFDGWYKDSSFNEQVTTLAGVTTNLSLHAKWTFNPGSSTYYTINFLSGGGTGTMSSQYAFEGEDTTLNAVTFTRSGYTFNKWTSNDGRTFTNGENLGEVTEDLILTATWKANYTPAPYIPSGRGGSGGGGGGGGGIISTQGAGGSGPNSAPATRKVAAEKMTVKGVMKTESVSWAYDPTSNKWKLNLKDVAGSAVPLADGFFSISNTVNQNVTDTYYFDEAGNMVTGWIQTGDNKWYFFENAMTADEGKMQHGWKQVSGTWYYFGQDGAMLQGSTTPDGYIVDADGKWVSNTTTA